MSGLPSARKTYERLANGQYRGEHSGSMSKSLSNANRGIIQQFVHSVSSHLSRSKRPSGKGGKKNKKRKTQKKRKTRKVRRST